jgi:hypothetical protein
MTRNQHSPAYVAELRGAWRVIVPVRGRLARKFAHLYLRLERPLLLG